MVTIFFGLSVLMLAHNNINILTTDYLLIFVSMFSLYFHTIFPAIIGE